MIHLNLLWMVPLQGLVIALAAAYYDRSAEETLVRIVWGCSGIAIGWMLHAATAREAK